MVAAALSLAVFYHGPQIPLLAGAQFLLVTWILLSSLARYADGFRLPLTPLSIALSLYWMWLGVSLLWSAAPVTSMINFWWVGSLVLVFWAYTLAPHAERVWSYVSRFALLGTLALCLYALAQLFVWREPPRSTFVNIHSFAALVMLIALPLSAYFLIARQAHARTRLYLLGACLFVLFFTIAATEGRGTSLSLLLSMTVLALLAARLVDWRGIVMLFALVLSAYVAANWYLHGGVSDGRLATLVDPASAGVTRFLIWRGAWDMLLASPWWGIGLGTYYLAWPPYRHPDDTSLGFFVHNDYLQIWIEAGLPALLLLLAAFVAVLAMMVRLWRRSSAAGALKLEALGLFTGLLAVAAHSFVDFNFYILPISIVAGLVLGRFHECVNSVERPRSYTLHPARLFQAPAYRLIAVLFALLPLSYFIALGASDHLYKRGFVLAGQGKLEEADSAFVWAERLLPLDDKVLTMHADLYRHVLARLPPSAEAERRALYDAALAMLAEAQQANRYRPLIHAVRGRLINDNADLAGSAWRTEVESAYGRAIELDPRFFATRMAYAGLLLAAGRHADAYRVLDGGIPYWYYPSETVLAYYEMTATIAKKTNQNARAADLEQRIAAMRVAIRNAVPLRPIAADMPPPTVRSAM